MEVFARLAYIAQSELLGRTSDNPISTMALAERLQKETLDDPELAAHFERQTHLTSHLEAVRLLEDAV